MPRGRTAAIKAELATRKSKKDDAVAAVPGLLVTNANGNMNQNQVKDAVQSMAGTLAKLTQGLV